MGVNKAVANSQINVRIPSFAVITLADNNIKSVSDKSAYDLKNSVKSDLKTSIEVISNRKWLINVSKEKDSSETYSASNSRVKSSDPKANTSSITVIYVTSLL